MPGIILELEDNKLNADFDKLSNDQKIKILTEIKKESEALVDLVKAANARKNNIYPT